MVDYIVERAVETRSFSHSLEGRVEIRLEHQHGLRRAPEQGTWIFLLRCTRDRGIFVAIQHGAGIDRGTFSA